MFSALAPVEATTAANPWLSAASALAPMAGKALGGSGGPVGGGGPSRAESSTRTSTSVESVFDSSGWVVNFGEGASISATSTKPAALGQNWLLLAAAGVAVWAILRRSK